MGHYIWDPHEAHERQAPVQRVVSHTAASNSHNQIPQRQRVREIKAAREWPALSCGLTLFPCSISRHVHLPDPAPLFDAAQLKTPPASVDISITSYCRRISLCSLYNNIICHQSHLPTKQTYLTRHCFTITCYSNSPTMNARE
jgi:hypothetical protein